MSNVNKTINKVKIALSAKGMMPLIDYKQFYGDNGPATCYVVHYGDSNPFSKHNNIVFKTCSKVELLKYLANLLKAGDTDG